MSKVPSLGTVQIDGLAREFRTNRLGQIQNGYSAYDLSSAVASDGNSNSYGSQTAGTAFNFNGTRGKFRHWYTNASGFLGLRGGNGPTTSTPSGFTDVSTSYTDDGFVAIDIPTFKIQGVSYGTCYVGSNGYITFGGGSSAYNGLNATNPPYPKIFIGAGDRNWTYVGKAIQYGYNNNIGMATSVTIRVETNSYYASNQTRGTADSVYELTFINTENCVDGYNFIGFALNTGNWVNGNGGVVSGVWTNGANLLNGGTLAANTTYAPYIYEYGGSQGYWSNGNWQINQWWYPWPNTTF